MSLPFLLTGSLPGSSPGAGVALPLARWAIGSSALLAALAVVASGVGLGWESLYRDNPLVRSGWWGNDAVTLVLGVPALLGATWWAARGSLPGRLAWLGAVHYVFYNFAFYLFGAAFNALFLAYVALFALSGYTLVAALVQLDAVPRVGRSTGRFVALWMGAVALVLGGFWSAVSAGFLFTGQVPAVVGAIGHPTNLIAALDLSMVVPLDALGAIWLWQRKGWGVVLAVIANVQGALFMAALTASTIAAEAAGTAEDVMQVALWGPIGLGSAIASIALLTGVRAETHTRGV